MNRCTSDFLLFTDRGQSFSDIKILSHLIYHGGGGEGWKENDIYYPERKHRDSEYCTQ